MMICRPDRRPARRRGATLVEFALLLTIFLLFLFGVFEYARYLLVLHTIENAARDGARYAVVSSNNAAAGTFTTDSASSEGYSSATPAFNVPFITTYTEARMGGVNKMLVGFKVRVYPCDTDGLFASPIAIKPKQQPTTANPTVSWNNAVFGERIAVRAKGQYVPLLPDFLHMVFKKPSDPDSDKIMIDVIALMGSEG